MIYRQFTVQTSHVKTQLELPYLSGTKRNTLLLSAAFTVINKSTN